MENSSYTAGQVIQRLDHLEGHIKDIRGEQGEFRAAMKEMAQSMNSLALQMSDRDSDQEKLRAIEKNLSDLGESFSRYREEMLKEKIKNSNSWIYGAFQWVGGVIAALLIFHFTGGTINGPK